MDTASDRDEAQHEAFRQEIAQGEPAAAAVAAIAYADWLRDRGAFDAADPLGFVVANPHSDAARHLLAEWLTERHATVRAGGILAWRKFLRAQLASAARRRLDSCGPACACGPCRAAVARERDAAHALFDGGTPGPDLWSPAAGWPHTLPTVAGEPGSQYHVYGPAAVGVLHYSTASFARAQDTTPVVKAFPLAGGAEIGTVIFERGGAAAWFTTLENWCKWGPVAVARMPVVAVALTDCLVTAWGPAGGHIRFCWSENPELEPGRPWPAHAPSDLPERLWALLDGAVPWADVAGHGAPPLLSPPKCYDARDDAVAALGRAALRLAVELAAERGLTLPWARHRYPDLAPRHQPADAAAVNALVAALGSTLPPAPAPA